MRAGICTPHSSFYEIFTLPTRDCVYIFRHRIKLVFWISVQFSAKPEAHFSYNFREIFLAFPDESYQTQGFFFADFMFFILIHFIHLRVFWSSRNIRTAHRRHRTCSSRCTASLRFHNERNRCNTLFVFRRKLRYSFSNAIIIFVSSPSTVVGSSPFHCLIQ